MSQGRLFKKGNDFMKDNEQDLTYKEIILLPYFDQLDDDSKDAVIDYAKELYSKGGDSQ